MSLLLRSVSDFIFGIGATMVGVALGSLSPIAHPGAMMVCGLAAMIISIFFYIERIR